MKISRLLVVLSFIALSGCAVSAASKYNRLSISIVTKENWKTDYKVHVNCPEEVKSIAVSPVIPLPPIIPVGFLNEDRSTFIVQTPHGVDVTAKFVDKEGAEVQLPINAEKWSGNEYAVAPYVTWSFEVGSTCRALDDHMFYVKIVDSVGQVSTAEFSLDFVEGDLRLESGYISAQAPNKRL